MSPNSLFSVCLGVYRALVSLSKVYEKKFQTFLLKFRWNLGQMIDVPQELPDICPTIDSIPVALINLPKRVDRLKQAMRELETAGFSKIQVVPGVEYSDSSLHLHPFFENSVGCSIAHSNALNYLYESGSEIVAVAEDDVQFFSTTQQLEEVLQEFCTNPRLKVLSIAGRTRGGSLRISGNLTIVSRRVGRGLYIAKRDLIPKLVESNFRGIRLLKKSNRAGKGDRSWNRLQTTRFFFAAPTSHLAQQSEGFSDIELRNLGAR